MKRAQRLSITYLLLIAVLASLHQRRKLRKHALTLQRLDCVKKQSPSMHTDKMGVTSATMHIFFCAHTMVIPM